MRITTQMLNQSARQAGLPLHTTSLLNYINNDNSTTDNTLLNTLNQNSKVDATQKSSYEQLEKSADALQNAVSVMTSEKEDNLFAQARETGNTADIKKQVKEFISNYNTMMEKLDSTDSTLNSYYNQTLGELYSTNKENLESIGISADKNGYLSLDESKFDAADIDTLEEVLGKASQFSVKAGYIAGRVANNAASYLESISSGYSANGQNYSSYTNSKYDFWG